MSGQITKADRDALIRIAKLRAKQAEREAETREKVLIAEVHDQLTAEFEANDRLWADAVTVASEAVGKANAHIRAQCAAMGIPPQHAPQVTIQWMTRSPSYSDRSRRTELYKLAETRLAALTKQAKTMIQGAVLKVETELLTGGLESGQARAILESMPTVETLMPSLSIEDLGVVHWQPPEDAATQLTTPLTPAQRKARKIRRAIVANPGASNRATAQIAGCDHKTVAAYREAAADGELPAIDGESRTGEEDGS
jgi:hypothetical protein